VNSSEIDLIIDRTLKFLDGYGGFLLTDTRLDFFRSRFQELSEKAGREIDHLYLGLVGGSGVGKSSLINAIAGSRISDPSDRRPFTDKIVVYRHERQERGLDQFVKIFKSPDNVHHNDSLKTIVILDLPDIDSLETSNREVVAEILPHLDAVVWVASPEKYADATLYDSIRASLIHQENFIFVLNKMDQILEQNGSDPYLRIKEISGDFGFQLKEEAGIVEPKLFCVSALLEFERGSSRDFFSHEFVRLRKYLTDKWNAKQINVVKRANLIEEIGIVLKQLGLEADLETKLKAVQQIQVRSLEESDLISELDFLDLRISLKQRTLEILAGQDNSIRPVSLVMSKLLSRRAPGNECRISELETILRTEASGGAHQKFLLLEKNLRHVSASLLFSTIREMVSIDDAVGASICDKCANVSFISLEILLEKTIASRTGIVCKLRRGMQGLILLFPLALMALKLSGVNSFSGMSQGFAWTSVPDHILQFFISLFSSEGLASITAFLITELILITVFSFRRLKKIEKIADKISSRIVSNLVSCLNESIKAQIDERVSALNDLRNGISSCSQVISDCRKMASA
jgi:hypothetical protein